MVGFGQMEIFQGTSSHTIDDKGRIVIPARFRGLLRTESADGLMVTKMIDQYLVGFPFNEWFVIATRIKQLAEKSETMRRFRRSFIGGASECGCDRQDRILVPPMLREYAGLKKDIVLVGVTDHFEIWSRENYEKEEVATQATFKDPEARNEIAKLGI